MKDFEIKRLVWFIRVSPKCHHKYPYKREAKGDLTTGDVMTEEAGVRLERAASQKNKVRKSNKMVSPLKPPEGMQPLQ